MQRKQELAKKKFEVFKVKADLEGSGESVVDHHGAHNKVENWLKYGGGPGEQFGGNPEEWLMFLSTYEKRGHHEHVRIFGC